jgi:geranyl-CoA carboxylase alpha subunit
MDIKLSYLDQVYDISIEQEEDVYYVSLGDKKYRITDVSFQDNKTSFRVDDRKYSMYSALDAGRSYLALEGEYYYIEQVRGNGPGVVAGAVQKTNSVSSPMPGLLVNVSVAVGDRVKDGQILAVVEAMKMQNELCAPRDGVVARVNFKEGEQIDAFQPIVELEEQGS